MIESLSRRRLMFAMMPRRMHAAITSWGFISSCAASSATEMNSLTRMVRGSSSTPTAASSLSSRRWWRRFEPSISARVRRTDARTSFSSTTRFFFFAPFPALSGPDPAGTVRRWASAMALAACTAFSLRRASSSFTASFSREILRRTCWTTLSSMELMWLFTSTDMVFKTETSASLDIPISLAASYTRRFTPAIVPLSRPYASGVGSSDPAPGFLLQFPAPRRQELLRFLEQLLGGLLADPLDREQLLERSLQEILHRLDPLAQELLPELGTGRLELLDVDAGAALVLLLALALALRDQVDLPAGELGRQAGVLPPLADRQGKLVVGHSDQDLLLHLDHVRLDHLRRGERAGDEDDRIHAPGHDVDLLAPQLPDDRLHARALDPDARADGVDLVVVRDHGNFRARAGLAGDSLDLDDLLRHLGDLGLEQPAQELRMRPRQDHLRPARQLVHGDDVRLDVVPLVKAVPRDLLARRKDRLGPVQLHVDVAAVHLLHGAAHHLADPVVEVLVDPLALRLAHPLHQHLLRGGDGVPAQVLQRQLLRDDLAQPGVRIRGLRLRQIDLPAQVVRV